MQLNNLFFSFFLFSNSVFSIPLLETCPIAACTAYALNNYTKKTACSGGCILEYLLSGSIKTCNSALSGLISTKLPKC